MNHIAKTWDRLPSHDVIERTLKNLQANGIQAVLAKDVADAKVKALALIPERSEVMTMTSVTSDVLGITDEINESGKFIAVKPKLASMDRTTQHVEMQKLGAAPALAIGSVHAVTEDGKLVIASNTGSQLPAYAYGSGSVVFVVGAQKIVSNIDEALERIYQYVLPLEAERARKAYGADGSFVSKLLIINREVKPGRVHVVLIPQVIGF